MLGPNSLRQGIHLSGLAYAPQPHPQPPSSSAAVVPSADPEASPPARSLDASGRHVSLLSAAEARGLVVSMLAMPTGSAPASAASSPSQGLAADVDRKAASPVPGEPLEPVPPYKELPWFLPQGTRVQLQQHVQAQRDLRLEQARREIAGHLPPGGPRPEWATDLPLPQWRPRDIETALKNLGVQCRQLAEWARKASPSDQEQVAQFLQGEKAVCTAARDAWDDMHFIDNALQGIDHALSIVWQTQEASAHHAVLVQFQKAQMQAALQGLPPALRDFPGYLRAHRKVAQAALEALTQGLAAGAGSPDGAAAAVKQRALVKALATGCDQVCGKAIDTARTRHPEAVPHLLHIVRNEAEMARALPGLSPTLVEVVGFPYDCAIDQLHAQLPSQQGAAAPDGKDRKAGAGAGAGGVGARG